MIDNPNVRKAQEGDQRAFEALVREHQDFAYHVALSALGSTQDAEDAVQEAFVRAWKALDSFRFEAKFSTWLYRIVMNICYNRLPKIKREFNSLPPEESGSEVIDRHRQRDPDAYLEGKELFEFIQQELDNLPENYRIMLLLRLREGSSYAEIAEILDIPLGTVKTGIHRAREQLKLAAASKQKEWVSL